MKKKLIDPQITKKEFMSWYEAYQENQHKKKKENATINEKK